MKGNSPPTRRRTRPHLAALGCGRDFRQTQATSQMDRSRTQIPRCREWSHSISVRKGSRCAAGGEEICSLVIAHNHQSAQVDIGLLFQRERIKDNATCHMKSALHVHPLCDAELTACKPFPSQCEYANRCPNCVESSSCIGAQINRV